MLFLVQLAFGDLPQGADLPHKDGILQLFYCSTDDGSCETWAPFSGTHCLRVVAAGSGLAVAPKEIRALPKVTIIGWTELQDTPDTEEHETLGVSYRYEFEKNRVHVECVDPILHLDNLDMDLDVAEAISTSEPGDKLCGWPHWIQGAEYPQCPDCGTQMELLLQIDSEDNLSYMFGDVGCGHITYCPKHPSIFAFGWACG